MDFPLTNLLDQDACYQQLLRLLHPDGLACPRCGGREGLLVHRGHRAPVLDYRCKSCRRVFNAFTATPLHGTHRRPAQILLILRGIVQGVSTARLCELGVSRPHLLELRHQLQARALAATGQTPLPDDHAEADEVFQNAGEKRPAARRADRPAPAAGEQGARPRHLGQRPAAAVGRRRPPLGAVTAAPGAADVGVGTAGVRHCEHAARGPGLNRRVDRIPPAFGRGPGAQHGLPRRRGVVRDDDGDGVREVHCNTLEGSWTGFRNFIRTFRGVSKWYLAQYAAVFQWGYNLKVVTEEFLRILLGCPVATRFGT